MLHHLFFRVANHKLYWNVFFVIWVELCRLLHSTDSGRKSHQRNKKNLEESEFTHEFRKNVPYHDMYCYLDMK